MTLSTTPIKSYQVHLTNVKIFAFLVLGLFSQACEESVDWQLDPGDNGQLVVEAILTDERSTQQIRLSQSYDRLEGTAPAVTGAEVSVEANGVTYRFAAVNLDPGLYQSEFPFAVLRNLEYKLEVNWQGEEYVASSRLSVVAPIPKIDFRAMEGRDGLLTFVEFAPLYNANQQAMYEMNVDWSHLQSDSVSRARMLFYTFSTVDASELIRPRRDTVAFPRGSIVTAKKFGLNDDFAAYLRALVIETDWNGGIYFYASPASLPTNISNGGLGFFSTCAVITDTLIAE